MSVLDADQFSREMMGEVEAAAEKMVSEVASLAAQRGLELTDWDRWLVRQSYVGGFADGGKFAMGWMQRQVEQHRARN